jgi:hypothetical protein
MARVERKLGNKGETFGEVVQHLHYSEKGGHRVRGQYWRAAMAGGAVAALPIEFQDHLRRKMIGDPRDSRR